MPLSEGDSASVEATAGWFYDHSKDGFAMSKGGVILRTNQAWCDMLRITREQAIGQTANDIVKADDLPVFHSSTAELQERGETTCSVRFNTATPKDIWVEVLARRGADGLVLIAAHDITARRELEAEREEIANVSALLNAHSSTWTWQYSPSEGLFVVDATRQPGTTSLEAFPHEVSLTDMLAHVDTEEARDAFLAALQNSVETGAQGQIGVPPDRWRWSPGMSPSVLARITSARRGRLALNRHDTRYNRVDRRSGHGPEGPKTGGRSRPRQVAVFG